MAQVLLAPELIEIKAISPERQKPERCELKAPRSPIL